MDLFGLTASEACLPMVAGMADGEVLFPGAGTHDVGCAHHCGPGRRERGRKQKEHYDDAPGPDFSDLLLPARLHLQKLSESSLESPPARGHVLQIQAYREYFQFKTEHLQ